MLDNYIEQVDEDLNIHLPKDIVEKLKIKSNDYIKVRMKTQKTIELILIKGEYSVQALEGSVFLPE